MSQDATKVVMAGNASNRKSVECFNVSPAGFPAGSVVSLASTGLPSLLKSDGMRMGVSKGKSLADILQTDVLRQGLRVPVLAHLKRSTGLITITNVANLVSGTDDGLTVGATTFTAQAGAATPGDATFQASGTTAQTATSLATQINAHAVAGLLVYAIASSATVRLYSRVEGAGSGNDVAVSYTDNDTNVGLTLSGLTGGKLAGGSNTISDIDYATKGLKMYVNDVTGKADVAMTGFSTISDAVYRDAPLTGIAEDASEVAAVVVDMQGGL